MQCTMSNEKWGMLLREVQNFPSNEDATFLYENMTNTSPSKPNASTMQNEKCNNA